MSSRAPRPPVPPPGPRSPRPARTARRRRQYVAAETRGGRPRPAWGIGTNVRWTGRSDFLEPGTSERDLGVVMTAAIWCSVSCVWCVRGSGAGGGSAGGPSLRTSDHEGGTATPRRSGDAGRRCPEPGEGTNVRSLPRSPNHERPFGVKGNLRTGVCHERLIVLPSPAWLKQHLSPPVSSRSWSSSTSRCGAAGYPPSVREIGEAVGLSSSSTVHAHLGALQDKGYLRRDPTKPRAIEICYEPDSGAMVDRRPVRHVPLVGDVAAGTGTLAAENIEETMPLPEDLTGDGQLFMLAGPRRVDDRRRHLRPRLRGRPPAGVRRERRHRRRRHPGRGGDREDVRAQAGQDHPAARRTRCSRTWCSTPRRSRSTARS